MRDILLLVGRILLVLAFISTGFSKFMNLGGTANYIASSGLPAPFVLAVLSGLVELGCGLAILVGYQTRLAALGLALFTLATIPFFHHFWNMTDQARMANEIQAWKNLSLVGAFLMLAGVGAGRLSIDRSSE
ncbi:DoxX family protein [Microvirga flavescens]|uniref:DoxX family protein n=1 Tax=Microvirga flavescens TaxID=2249811 RepID=UPI000DD69AB0|nr:DoxX family protein [Microvirga flavescens]